jgi:hypothetical protein
MLFLMVLQHVTFLTGDYPVAATGKATVQHHLYIAIPPCGCLC